MAIRRYYLAQSGVEVVGEVAAPNIVIDLMLAEKYGWTPQEIHDIPRKWMEEMMLTLNSRINVNSEIEMRREKLGEKTKIDPYGGNGLAKHRVLS